jgi:hypothetical protein
MAVMAREAWTDERLDDLNARFDGINARFDAMQRLMISTLLIVVLGFIVDKVV